jgi:2'-5' RNA ligase
MNADDPIQFVVISVLPGDAAAKVEAARREATLLTGSRAALAWPPHVTLRTGAMVPSGRVSEFVDAMGRALGAWRPFALRTEGIVRETYPADDGSTHNLVAWQVPLDAPLADLHRRLLGCTLWQRRPQPPFHPHLTLAFDDLDDPGAARLLAAAGDRTNLYPARLAWTCDKVCLHRNVGGRWEEFHAWWPELTRS